MNPLEPCPPPDLPPELSLYRERTLAILRRYERLAVEIGRLPSLVGEEYFRTRVTSYRLLTFEDVVVFVHDIERALQCLKPRSRMLLARIAIQDYTEIEVAHELGLRQRRVRDLYYDALDALSQVFLRRGILNAARDARRPRRSLQSFLGKPRRRKLRDGASEGTSPAAPDLASGAGLTAVNTPEQSNSAQAYDL